MQNSSMNMANGLNEDGSVNDSGEQPFLKQRTLINEIVDQKNSSENDEGFNKKFFYVSGFVSFLKNDDKTYYLALMTAARRK